MVGMLDGGVKAVVLVGVEVRAAAVVWAGECGCWWWRCCSWCCIIFSALSCCWSDIGCCCSWCGRDVRCGGMRVFGGVVIVVVGAAESAL